MMIREIYIFGKICRSNNPMTTKYDFRVKKKVVFYLFFGLRLLLRLHPETIIIKMYVLRNWLKLARNILVATINNNNNSNRINTHHTHHTRRAVLDKSKRKERNE